MILLDTNILIRMTQAFDPQCACARNAIQHYQRLDERLIVVPQNLYEFWAVATRPKGTAAAGGNGLGMTTTQAAHWLRFVVRRFTFLPDRDELSRIWFSLVESIGVTGFRAHDARLVAAMQSYGISQLLTFNTNHFRDLPVTVIDPASV